MTAPDPSTPVAAHDDRASVEAWAASGLMPLSGPAHARGLGPPAPLVAYVDRLTGEIERLTAAGGSVVRLDGLQLLGERAAIGGLTKNGTTSCGGATRLLPSIDGWLAVALARPSDVDLVPAWLAPWSGDDVAGDGFGVGVGDGVGDQDAADPWVAVAGVARQVSAAELVEAAIPLGLPVARLGERLALPLDQSGVSFEWVGPSDVHRPFAAMRVVDLSSLWAGPLCGSILGLAGAEVIKVESTERPDGARRGPPEFFDLMNAGKRSVALDLTSAEGTGTLRRLLESADIVIEASRPRALEQMGIDSTTLLRAARPSIWISITGHGRAEGQRDRVGFGDDAAVAGGLVVWDEAGPSFCGDAIADPLAGLAAAATALDLVATGGSWMVDVALASVAATAAGPTLPVSPDVVASLPQSRPVTRTAPVLGQDTAAVLAELTS